MTQEPTTFDLEDIPETMSVKEAAAVLGVQHYTIRRAIWRGELEAVMPRGRDPQRAGRMGYRITREALRSWYFGGRKT